MDELTAFLGFRWDEIEIPDWHERTCQTHQPMPGNYPFGPGTPMSCNCQVIEYVMADVAAKRQIIELHRPGLLRTDRMSGTVCMTCSHVGGFEPGPHWFQQNTYPCPTLRLLAQPYRGHPDFRPEWSTL